MLSPLILWWKIKATRCHPNYAPHGDMNSNINPNLENNQTTDSHPKAIRRFLLRLNGTPCNIYQKCSEVKWLYLTWVVPSVLKLLLIEANSAPLIPVPLSELRFTDIWSYSCTDQRKVETDVLSHHWLNQGPLALKSRALANWATSAPKVRLHLITHITGHKCLNQEIKHTYPIVTSNILLPMELETAMSPKPFLATKTLVIRSGMLVPAARNVSPITCETKDTRDLSFTGYGTGNRFLINKFQKVTPF